MMIHLRVGMRSRQAEHGGDLPHAPSAPEIVVLEHAALGEERG